MATSVSCSASAATANQGANGTFAPAAWVDDLAPIVATDWSEAHAAHLLERAGFGGTPEEVRRLAAMTPFEAVAALVHYERIDDAGAVAFDPSGLPDEGIDPFPPSRPATTAAAKQNGEAIGVKVKPEGDRRMQAVVDKFFYWLRASLLETHRIGQWWASRMVSTRRPLEEKMTLFWHGHFATSEDKVRDWRKMLLQNSMFRELATSNFRNLLVRTSQDPAMLVYLDAGLNSKDAINENFAREIMELFTMGVGHYTEHDIREAARAFTGWNVKGLDAVIDPAKHDASDKTVLGRTGPMDGVDVIDLILAQPATAEFVAARLYAYFVREEPSASLRMQLGALLRNGHYEIKPFLTTLFLSHDFYSTRSMGTRIKSPVELVVSTYRKLGLDRAPGMPDFTSVTAALGQELLRPPTVAGWAAGTAWITPSLLFERGNFARDVMFPDVGFLPPDRYAPGDLGESNRAVGANIARGMDISSATKPAGREGGDAAAMSTAMADRDEAFNTRYGSFRGWQMAMEAVKPILRDPARLDLTSMVLRGNPASVADVVDTLVARFLVVAPDPADRARIVAFLREEIGTDDVGAARSYLEQPLRMALHLILSLPEYQLS